MSSLEAGQQSNTRTPHTTQREGRGRGGGNQTSLGLSASNSMNGTHGMGDQDLITETHHSLALRPAPIVPVSSAEPSSAEGSATENGGVRGRLSRGRGRGRGRVAQTRGRNQMNGRHLHSNDNRHAGISGARMGPRRQFGGQLTVDEDAQEQASISTSTLHPDAPEFVPGRPHQTQSNRSRSGSTRQNRRGPIQAAASRARRGSIIKSQAADLATRTHEDITHGAYECPICTSEIDLTSRVWSCRTCWTVFHLGCVKTWATNEGSTQAQRRNEDGTLPPPRQWRCPGCNLGQDELPLNYSCWCGKEEDPRPIAGVPPHSCGQTCNKPRSSPKDCPHPCHLSCHAGPCPPCTFMGPVQICFCGKQAVSRKCVDTNYKSGWSCNETCGDLLPCGVHFCSKPCHSDLCGACEIPMESRCYCGRQNNLIKCCDRGEEKESNQANDGSEGIETWIGSFDCTQKCQRQFDCGKHECERRCHPQDIDTPHCPRSTDNVFSCPCGKTLLDDISAKPRESCEDSIPNCDKLCSKLLPCGHSCHQICHSDQCMPCLLNVKISCRCGRTESTTICHQGCDEAPQCTRPCRAILSCGRHECGERCCTGERKAAERQATKRKLKHPGASQAVDENFEPEHLCLRTCGRLLKCGSHHCRELCHRGPCESCPEALFDEISCHCGKTVLQPPLPCGTKPPLCRFDCDRPRLCGHPPAPHNCHGDDESCPRCAFLTSKPCLCGKSTLKNQPCFLMDVRCGEPCGRKLRCGSHFCRRLCHRPGECEDSGGMCQQACGKAKKACGHLCVEPCHAPSPCKEENSCQSKMFITCPCQHRRQEVKCNASKGSEGNSRKALTCDEECATLARKQQLAQALNIDPEAHKDNYVPYSSDTLKMYRDNIKWSQSQEREFRVLASDENEKRLRFKPMPSQQRAFLHSLAEDFGFESESMDPEPHRHVLVFKTSKFVKAPMKTLAECLRIRIAETSNAPAIENRKRLRSSLEPYNGFLLTNPRFGLTLDELRADYASAFASTPGLGYDIAFLPSEEIVIKARPASASTAISPSALAASIEVLKPSLLATTSSKRIAGSIQLCALDASLNILRRELDEPANNGGWSQVAAKGAAPRTLRPEPGVGQKSSFTVLGSRLKQEKKRREEVKKALEAEVVDDWEEMVRRDEEGDTLIQGAGVDADTDTAAAIEDVGLGNQGK